MNEANSIRAESSPNEDALPSASLELLKARHLLLKKIRRFFDDRDFLEVTTPLLSADCVVDEHLDPFQVVCYSDPTTWEVGPVRYLQTSPEFHMKRLLCGGATSIYQVTHAFRAAEVGPLHNPEFSMAEWYRVGDDMQQGIDLLCDLIQTVAKGEWNGHPIEGCQVVERQSYAAAFGAAVGFDPQLAPLDELRRAAGEHARSDNVGNLTRDDCVQLLWSMMVTPRLASAHPIVIFDFPASQAALAQVRDASPPVAARFELYWQGVELANGYHELRCAEEFRTRVTGVQEKRSKAGKMPLPGDSRLHKAMQKGLPDCSGTALGVDRLLMLLCREKTLTNVLTFGFSRA